MIPQHGTLEIFRSRLRHNLDLFRNKIGPGAELCPIIKANAYGHGMHLMAEALQDYGTQWVAVYNLQEAVSLARETGLKVLALAPVHIAGTETQMLQRLVEWSDVAIRINVTDLHTAKILSQAVPPSVRSWPIHVQIDTGLTRLGVDPGVATDFCKNIARLSGLHLEGLFSHLSHSEVPGHPTVAEQVFLFHRIADPLKRQFPHLLLHLQNSGGTFNLPADNLDLVRIGIALYGLQPSTAHPIKGLQPIAQLTAPILAIHDRPAHTGVGYGHTFTTTRPSRLAIVPVGYADGYPRQLSNTKNAIAQLRGVDVPVVGRISMDQIILDITDIPTAATGPVQPGEIVTVISNNPAKPNSLDQMATAINTIGYELATHLGPRLNRVIVE